MKRKLGIDAEYELALVEESEKQREISDKAYAKIIIEKIVFGLISMILVAFASYLISLVIKQ